MKHWILAVATLLLIQGVDAREHRGPPSACPQPKADCKPKCCPPAPKPCPPKACKPQCPQPDPCCPPACFERGLPTNSCCTPSAYSESAAIDLRCGSDLFFTANFIYWEAIQGGMDLAVPGEGTISDGALVGPVISSVGHSIFKQGFEYKPGFQLGLGWSGAKDNWGLYAEYTWLHGSTSSSAAAPAPGVASINGIALPQDGIWFPTSWFPNQFTNQATTHISSKWTYKIDLLDAQISRPFYSGARYTVEPFFGLRGAWIRQQMSLSAVNLPTAIEIPGPTRHARYSSRSAGVGPRLGMNGNWHLGYGIRFMGDAAASLLFSSYDVKQNVESPEAVDGNPFPIKTKISNLNGLRPNLDLSLGLGWGAYLGCRRFYLDLAATYDFSIFWEQNMMRYLADLSSTLTDGAPSNLYLQGLTIQTRFEF